MKSEKSLKKHLYKMDFVPCGRNTTLLVPFAIITVLIFAWYIHNTMVFGGMDVVINGANVNKAIHILPFSNEVVKYDRIRKLCYGNTDPQSIEDLASYVLMLKKHRNIFCQYHFVLFNSIYNVYFRYATISISETFMLKLKAWLNSREDLINTAQNQSLIFITNLYSYERVVFNTVRAHRPVTSVTEGSALSYINHLVMKSERTCDLCSYVNNTASDLFGRMVSVHSVITSITFKVGTYHSIAILKTHHPLFFTQTQFIDCIHLIMKWFNHVHDFAPGHLYRQMLWDIIPKAGATKIHPHIHVILADHAYHAKWNQMYYSGLKFSKQHHGINYWTSLLQIHTSLGLSVRFGNASLMAYLNPQKDAEIMVISEKPCLEFFRLVYFTIRGFIDDMGLYALSMGFVFPKMAADTRYGDELPMLFRVVSRGSADSPRSDIGSFGFFGTVNVNRDPFKLIQQIRESVKKGQAEEFADLKENV